MLKAAALGLLVGCVAVCASAADLTAYWTNPAGGLWTDPNNWSTNPVYPGNANGNAYVARIELPGTFEVLLDRDITLSGLVLNAPAATLRHQKCKLTMLGQAVLTSGTWRFVSTTEIVGGIWHLDGAEFVMHADATWGFGSMTLRDCEIYGQYSQSPRLATYLSNVTFHEPLDAANGGFLYAVGPQTLSHVIQVAPDRALNVAGKGGLLTIAPEAGVIGGSLRLDAYLSPGIVNHGLISAVGAGGEIYHDGGYFSSDGVVAASEGAALHFDGGWRNLTGGLITVDGGTHLFVFPPAALNDGTIRAHNATLHLKGSLDRTRLGDLQYGPDSTITLWHAIYDNTGETLRFDANTGSWHVYYSDILGGTIEFHDGTRLVFEDGQNELRDVNIVGDFEVDSPDDGVWIMGGLQVSGEIRVLGNSAVVLGAPMDLPADTWLAGTDYTNQADLVVDCACPLTIPAGRLVHGHTAFMGSRGGADHESTAPPETDRVCYTMLNRGTIRADTPGPSPLALAADQFTNEGVMEAVTGGTLQYKLAASSYSGNWVNTADGIVRATDANMLFTPGNGSFTVTGTNEGRMTATRGELQLGCQWTNNGMIEAFDNSLFWLGGSTEEGWTNNSLIDIHESTLKFTNQDSLGLGGTNYGTIRLDNSAGEFKTRWTNAGTLDLRGTSTATVTPAKLLNFDPNTGILTGGTWLVANSAKLDLTGAQLRENRATIELDGTLTGFGALTALRANAGTLRLKGGRNLVLPQALTNKGLLTLGSNSRVVAPLGFAQDATGELSIELGPESVAQPRIQVNNAAATLGGTLRVRNAGDYAPPVGTTIVLVQATGLGGAFATRDIDAWPQGHWKLTQTATQVTLTAAAGPPQPGDMDGNGWVTFADIDPFVAALGGKPAFDAAFPGSEFYNADCNGDGVVNFADVDPFVGRLGTTYLFGR